MNETNLSLLDGVIPLIVPLLIAFFKNLLPRLPKALLPILAPVLGALADITMHYAGLNQGNALTGAILGATGLWLREAFDQSRKALGGSAGSAGLLMVLLVPLFGLSACATRLAPGGVYNGDTFLYNADKTITSSYDVLHTFVKWEHDNRASLAKWPEIKRTADTVRVNADKWISSATALREAYAAEPSATNKEKLTTSLRVLRAALAESTRYLQEHQAH